MKKLNETYLKGKLKFDCDSTSNWSGTEKSRENACASSQASVFKFCEAPKKKNPNGMGE